MTQPPKPTAFGYKVGPIHECPVLPDGFLLPDGSVLRVGPMKSPLDGTTVEVVEVDGKGTITRVAITSPGDKLKD